jgi:uncharacterized phage-associated protein
MSLKDVGKMLRHCVRRVKYLLDIGVRRIRMGVTSVSQEDVTMPYDAKAVANWFLEKAQSKDKSLTPMKAQKLVFFAHGWYLALKDARLIGEPVYAWKWGPVIKSLYDAFKSYGSGPITQLAKSPGRLRGVRATGFATPHVPDRDADTIAFLERIWDVYGRFSGIQLSNMTHMDGTPWKDVYKQYGGEIPPHTEIPESSIKSYFEKLATTNSNASKS